MSALWGVLTSPNIAFRSFGESPGYTSPLSSVRTCVAEVWLWLDLLFWIIIFYTSVSWWYRVGICYDFFLCDLPSLSRGGSILQTALLGWKQACQSHIGLGSTSVRNSKSDSHLHFFLSWVEWYVKNLRFPKLKSSWMSGMNKSSIKTIDCEIMVACGMYSFKLVTSF